MAERYLLSQADRDKLSKLLGDANSSKVPYSPQDPRYGAPEVYVACPSLDPIPALTPASGGESYDHPGCAPCDIYQVMPSAAGGQGWDLVPISGLSFPVYNFSYVTVSGWILAVRDKGGRWWAVPAPEGGYGSGSGSGSGSNGSGSGPCANKIGNYNLSDIVGYAAGTVQFLAHDENGCLKWISVGNCYGSGSAP